MKRLRILHVGVALAGALLAALPWLTSSAYLVSYGINLLQ